MNATTREASTSDEEIAQRVGECQRSQATGEGQRALAELYQRHAPLLIAFLATRVHRNRLDDVHQEIWLKVWVKIGEQFTGGNFRAWLYQIARNHLIDLVRKRKDEDSLPAEVPLSDPRQQRPDEVLMDRESKRALQNCLERLEAELADVVRARLAGESYEGISERMAIPADRCHKLYHTAKERLKACVSQAE